MKLKTKRIYGGGNSALGSTGEEWWWAGVGLESWKTCGPSKDIDIINERWNLQMTYGPYGSF